MKNTNYKIKNTLEGSQKEEFLDHIREVSKFFKLISCKKRLLIISELIEKSMSVTEIQKLIKLSQPSASNHLKVLYDMDIVDYDKKGRTVYYKINKKRFDSLITCLNNCKLDS